MKHCRIHESLSVEFLFISAEAQHHSLDSLFLKRWWCGNPAQCYEEVMRVSSLLAVQHSSLLFVWLSTGFVHLCGSLADASRQSNPGEVRLTAQQLWIILTNLTEFVWTQDIHRQLRKSVRNIFYILFVTIELKLVKRLCHDWQQHSAEWDAHFKLKVLLQLCCGFSEWCYHT